MQRFSVPDSTSSTNRDSNWIHERTEDKKNIWVRISCKQFRNEELSHIKWDEYKRDKRN